MENNILSDDIEKIYLAAIRDEDMSKYGVKQTPENIAMYWRMRFAANDLAKSGDALQVPN
jgi:hypothetical protein